MILRDVPVTTCFSARKWVEFHNAYVSENHLTNSQEFVRRNYFLKIYSHLIICYHRYLLNNITLLPTQYMFDWSDTSYSWCGNTTRNEKEKNTQRGGEGGYDGDNHPGYVFNHSKTKVGYTYVYRRQQLALYWVYLGGRIGFHNVTRWHIPTRWRTNILSKDIDHADLIFSSTRINNKNKISN